MPDEKHSLSYKETGQLLMQSGGWEPEPVDNSSAKWTAIVIGVLAGLGVFGLSTPLDMPGSIIAAIIGGLVFGVITYSLMEKK